MFGFAATPGSDGKSLIGLHRHGEEDDPISRRPGPFESGSGIKYGSFVESAGGVRGEGRDGVRRAEEWKGRVGRRI